MRLRPPTPDDAESAFAVILARDIADLGRPDFTLDDLLEEWAAPGFDLGRDAVVAEDEDGAIVGYAAVDPRASFVLVHPQAEGRGIGTALRERIETRVGELGTPLRQVVVPTPASVAHLTAAGYHRAHVYQRMEADLAAVPPPPGDVPVRRFDLDREGAAVHELVEEAFAEIPGNVSVGFDRWLASLRTRSEPEFLLAADLDGVLAGAAIGENWEDGVGYVAQIATSPAARGRGLGRALLLTLLAALRDAGLSRAELSVHGTNAPATGLYESAGMRPTFRQERWER